MSQYLYNKAILEKIAAEKEKSDNLLNALGVGTAAAGVGGGIGYGIGRYHGNNSLSRATDAANKLRDAEINVEIPKQVQASKASQAANTARKSLNALNFDVNKLKGEIATITAEAEAIKTKSGTTDPTYLKKIQAAEKRMQELKRVEEVTRPQLTSNYEQLNKAKELFHNELTEKANKAAADTISEATANRLNTIKKYTKGGLGIGLGVGLGAYGAKKLYDRYRGTEKKASYTRAVLEKIAEDDMIAQEGSAMQDDLKRRAAQAASVGAPMLAGGLVARNLLNRATKAHEISHSERARSAADALSAVRNAGDPSREEIDKLIKMTKRSDRSEMFGKVLNNKYTRGVGMGMGAIGAGMLGKKVYDAYKQRQDG